MTIPDAPRILRRHPLAICAAVLAAALGLFLSHYGFRASALINFGSDSARIEEYLEPGFVVFTDRSGYDAQWEYAIACDPLARRRLYDDPYRYQRIGLPAAARLLALGNRAWIPAAMGLLGFAGAMLAGWVLLALLRLNRQETLAPWLPFAVCSAAQVVQLQLTNGIVLSTGLALLGLWLREKGRLPWMAAALAGALLVRESALVVLAGIGLWELKDRRWRSLAWLAAALVPYAAWQLYLHQAFGRWAIGTSSGHLGFPLAGMAQRLVEIPPEWTGLPHAEQRLRQIAVLALLAYLVLAIAAGARQFLRAPSLYGLLLILHGAVVLSLTPSPLVDWNATGRVFLPVPFFYLLSLRGSPRPLDTGVLWGGLLLAAAAAVKIAFFNVWPYGVVG